MTSPQQHVTRQRALPTDLLRGSGIAPVTGLAEPKPYRWRGTEQRREAEVAARLTAVRERLAARGERAPTFCLHCRQPVQRCDDSYPAHRERCNGWRHRDGFHRCDPRHATGDVHAEPGATP